MSTINKYIWVVNALYRARDRGLSLKELNERWLREDISNGNELQRQTFDRWKGKILEMMGVIIDCNLKNDYRYYISNPDVLKSGELSRWLLDTYTTFNSLSRTIPLKDRILVEAIPSSRDYLTDILDAMRSNKVMEMTYKNFVGGRCSSFPVAPYCVRMAQKRWYMLALSINEHQVRMYGLDRIEKINTTDETFKLPNDFDAKEYFSTFFGVVCDDTIKEERIVLRAGKYHQNYMRSLPLHESQREIYACDDYAEFELRLRPTYDFCMELLRYGGELEVLEPKSLRHQMHAYAWEIWEMYKND